MANHLAMECRITTSNVAYRMIHPIPRSLGDDKAVPSAILVRVSTACTLSTIEGGAALLFLGADFRGLNRSMAEQGTLL